MFALRFYLFKFQCAFIYFFNFKKKVKIDKCKLIEFAFFNLNDKMARSGIGFKKLKKIKKKNASIMLGRTMQNQY